ILNVPRGYASGFDSPAALLDGHFEHPARGCSEVLDLRTIEFPLCHIIFPSGAWGAAHVGNED
ncbi:MAG: hypothetical protein AABZ17_05905, partial [Nitrospirota bacterium]